MSELLPHIEWPDPDGVERQPCDPDLMARVRARARGEVYSKERHGPFETPVKPPRELQPETPTPFGNIREIIDRFMAKGPKRPAVNEDWRDR